MIRRARRATLAAFVVVGLLAAPAGGQDPGTEQSGVGELQERYDEAVAQESALLEAYDESVVRLAELNEQIVTLNDSISSTEADLLDAEQHLRLAQDELVVTEVRLAEVEAELEAAQDELNRQVVDSYIFGGDDASLAAALLQAETVEEYRTTRVYAEAVIEDQDRVVHRFLSLRDEADGLRQQAQGSRDAAQAARDEVADRQAALLSERDRYGEAQADAFIAAAGQQKLISDVQAQKGDYQLRLAVLQGTSDSITGLLQGRQQGQTLPPVTVGLFARPVPGGITSGYGPRLHPIFGEVRQHNGLDMGGGMGQPIAAAGDGIVISADSRGGYGNAVVVDHGNALGTVYAHMSSFSVNPGDVVRRGDVLGGVGSTGFSTGPHLHWEVRVFGVPVDPVPYLEK
jgi:murein DD-endopeptidase MepM/ murein hydrolase activator NlpD